MVPPPFQNKAVIEVKSKTNSSSMGLEVEEIQSSLLNLRKKNIKGIL